MNSLLFVIGLFIKVWFVDDSLHVQPNNRYTWVEYNEIRYSLKEKEIFIFKAPENIIVITVGIE